MASLYAAPYNGTIATGGDSLNGNINMFYEVGAHWRSRSAAGVMETSTLSNMDSTVGRYCVDDHVDRTCSAHDSWSWVRHQKRDGELAITDADLVSSIPVSPVESRRCH